MDKKTADKYIYEYKDRIFGYAMEKMRNIDQAQELASDIICEVYCSFLRADDIVNIDGYVYRIARNVRAKYIDRLVMGRRTESIDDMVIPYNDEPSIEDAEDIEALRREIGYLSDRQRLIIYMHYYDNMSVADIAEKLRVSAGTVKWHLSDARSKLKEGITMTNELNLGLNPVKFVNMGHSGRSGSTGDTMDMFDTRLKQNIAYACYWEPKTLEEIARTVGVPQAYIADNLEKLVDYAYIDKLDNSKNPKYRTNMFITDSRRYKDKGDNSADKAAELLCDKFIPKVFEEFEADPAHWGFSCDGGDVNFMKYSLVMACVMRLSFISESSGWKYCVKRPDGGDFIAFANVTDDQYISVGSPKKNMYWTCGTMTRDNWSYSPETSRYINAFENVSVDCRFSDRSGGWRDNLNSDWETLVKFINDGRDSLTAEEYKRLRDKGYVHEDRVQPVILRVKLNDGETLGGSFQRLIDGKVIIPPEIERLSRQMDDEAFAAEKNNYPEHIHPVLKEHTCTNVIGGPNMIPRIVEKLLERGLLKPLTDIQRKSAFSVLCMNAE